jgi:hypothetical protein
MVREIDDNDEELDDGVDIDDLDELVDDDSDHSGLVGFVVGLLVGGVIGAGVMLFAAPERGVVTRRRVRKRIEDFGDDATHELARHRRQIRKRLKGRRR